MRYLKWDNLNSNIPSRLYEQATLHTSVGDIHVQLFPKECPKTVENFCVHSRNGYYNGHIFHRVIKQFMIQVRLGYITVHPVKSGHQ